MKKLSINSRILIIIFLGFCSLASAKELKKDKTSTVTLITNISPPKSQGATGFCYGFAANELIQQYSCKTAGSNCESPDEIISVIDVIRGGKINNNGLAYGGYSFDVLDSLRDGVDLATEDCAPFPKVYLNGQLSLATWAGTIESEKARDIWTKLYWWASSDTDKIQAATQFIDIMNFIASPEEISFYLINLKPSYDIYEDFNRFLAKFLVPASCYTEGRTVSIPPFSIKRFPHGQVSLKTVAKLISKNIPVQWSFNIFTLNPSGSITFQMGRHAVAIIGIRVNGKKTEFLIRDSGLREGFNYWLEDSIMEKVLTRNNENQDPFIWIEAR